MALHREFAALSAPARQRPAASRRIRLPLADGRATTVHVATYDLATTELRVAVMGAQQRLEPWCESTGVQEAVVGGFFVRPHGLPLGEVRTAGVLRRHVPFAQPWGSVRACVHVEGGEPVIAGRRDLPAAPRGDLLQAGPLLVRHGRPWFDADADAEGFSAASHEFDSDITEGRHPRAALGLADGRALAVVCDGRARTEAGLSLDELARLMTALGCHTALNLDGGGSATLISGGRLRNRPRGGFERVERGGRPVSTALVFLPRG